MTNCRTKSTSAPKCNASAQRAPVIVCNDRQEIKMNTSESHAKPFYQISYYRGGWRERRSFANLNEAKREVRINLGNLAHDNCGEEHDRPSPCHRP